MLHALLATILVFVSVGILLYLVTLLFNAAAGPLGIWVERQRFARYVARARAGDVLLERGDVDAALQVLRTAFYLHTVSSRGLASNVANHHTGLLSRLLSISAEVQGGTVRLLSLAKTDRLLGERSDLQRRYFTARESGRAERVRDAEQRLRTNARDVAAALEHLVAEVRAVRQPVRYH